MAAGNNPGSTSLQLDLGELGVATFTIQRGDQCPTHPSLENVFVEGSIELDGNVAPFMLDALGYDPNELALEYYKAGYDPPAMLGGGDLPRICPSTRLPSITESPGETYFVDRNPSETYRVNSRSRGQISPFSTNDDEVILGGSVRPPGVPPMYAAAPVTILKPRGSSNYPDILESTRLDDPAQLAIENVDVPKTAQVAHSAMSMAQAAAASSQLVQNRAKMSQQAISNAVSLLAATSTTGQTSQEAAEKALSHLATSLAAAKEILESQVALAQIAASYAMSHQPVGTMQYSQLQSPTQIGQPPPNPQQYDYSQRDISQTPSRAGIQSRGTPVGTFGPTETETLSKCIHEFIHSYMNMQPSPDLQPNAFQGVPAPCSGPGSSQSCSNRRNEQSTPHKDPSTGGTFIKKSEGSKIPVPSCTASTSEGLTCPSKSKSEPQSNASVCKSTASKSCENRVISKNTGSQASCQSRASKSCGNEVASKNTESQGSCQSKPSKSCGNRVTSKNNGSQVSCPCNASCGGPQDTSCKSQADAGTCSRSQTNLAKSVSNENCGETSKASHTGQNSKFSCGNENSSPNGYVGQVVIRATLDQGCDQAQQGPISRPPTSPHDFYASGVDDDQCCCSN